MIDIKDIRLGNYVTVDNPKYHPALKGKALMVVGIEDYRDKPSVLLMHIDPKENYIIPLVGQWIEFIKPIPLDEKKLLELGFNKNHDVYSINEFEIAHMTDGSGKRSYQVIFNDDPCLRDFYYVHELQNLAYELAIEKLTIKP